jgi:hypothetical protein
LSKSLALAQRLARQEEQTTLKQNHTKGAYDLMNIYKFLDLLVRENVHNMAPRLKAQCGTKPA